MRMKKYLAAVFVALCTLSLSACQKTNTAQPNEAPGVNIRIASLKGPTSMGLAKLYNDSDAKLTHNQYDYQIYTAADEISAGILKGEIDVAAVPANLASILYNKTEGGIQIAAINTSNVLYILSKGIEIQSIQDLADHTIYTTGQGTTPEYTLRYALANNQLDPDADVDIQFLSEASEVVAKISEMEEAIVMLPQPFVTVAANTDENLQVALSLDEVWKDIHADASIVTGVIIARTAFIQDNALPFQEFLTSYKESAEYVNTHVEEAASLMEQFDIIKAPIAKKAIPACNITCITGEPMKKQVQNYLSILYDFNAKSVGGSLPDDAAYFINESKDF